MSEFECATFIAEEAYKEAGLELTTDGAIALLTGFIEESGQLEHRRNPN